MVEKSKESDTYKKSTSKVNRYSQTILNSLSAHVAILDENGFILETNLAWKQFAEQNQIQMRPDTLGINYLQICESANGFTNRESSFVAKGIRDVIAAQREEFVMDYPCHAPDEKRWFYMRVTRAAGQKPLRIVVSHENITAIKLAEKRLQQSEMELRREKHKLEEANTALKVLLRQHEINKHKMESDVLDNVRRLVFPVLNQLGKQSLPKNVKRLLTTLEFRLSELTTPFLRRLSSIYSTLTPQEIEIATLIREGYSSKEIAHQLHLSITTVNFHRRNLRRKLNLRNTQTNLRSFLLGLTD